MKFKFLIAFVLLVFGLGSAMALDIPGSSSASAYPDNATVTYNGKSVTVDCSANNNLLCQMAVCGIGSLMGSASTQNNQYTYCYCSHGPDATAKEMESDCGITIPSPTVTSTTTVGSDTTTTTQPLS